MDPQQQDPQNAMPPAPAGDGGMGGDNANLGAAGQPPVDAGGVPVAPPEPVDSGYGSGPAGEAPATPAVDDQGMGGVAPASDPGVPGMEQPPVGGVDQEEQTPGSAPQVPGQQPPAPGVQ